MDLAIGIQIMKKGIQDTCPATSSVYYSGTNVSDDKEKPVGNDSVSKMNWYWYGGLDPVSFGMRNAIAARR